MSLCREDPCDPCPRHCRRSARTYVGWMGWLGYIVEGITLVVMALMVIGIVSIDYRIVLGLLVATIILDFIFWLVNLFRFAPCYTTQTLKNPCDPCGCGCCLIVKGDPCDYATRVEADLRQSNDDGHLRTALVGGLIALLYFGIFIAKYGTSSMNGLQPGAGLAQIPIFGYAQSVRVFIVLTYAYGFKLILENHSDLMFRHFTALPAILEIDDCGNNVVYAKQANLNKPFNNRRNPIDNL